MCKANVSLRVKENGFNWDWEHWKWLFHPEEALNRMIWCFVTSYCIRLSYLFFPISQFKNNNFRKVTNRSRSVQTGKKLCTLSSVRSRPRYLPMQTSCWILHLNTVVAYGGWVPRNIEDWNCLPHTQTEYPLARPTCNPATSPAHHAEGTSGMAQPAAMGLVGNAIAPRGSNPRHPT